jgi:hypothetical protein
MVLGDSVWITGTSCPHRYNVGRGACALGMARNAELQSGVVTVWKRRSALATAHDGIGAPGHAGGAAVRHRHDAVGSLGNKGD